VFDGSDTMPGEVGSGSFWRGMVAWVTGQKDTATVLTEIDESWPDY
jgi:alpha-glucoside transport system substrate-binding protein